MSVSRINVECITAGPWHSDRWRRDTQICLSEVQIVCHAIARVNVSPISFSTKVFCCETGANAHALSVCVRVTRYASYKFLQRKKNKIVRCFMESMRQLINSNNLYDLRRNKRKKIKINVVKGSHVNKKKTIFSGYS